MRFGFHVSISAGLARVRARAEALGCETIQLFTTNPRSWRQSALDPANVDEFRKGIRESGISPVFAHAPYLPNPATADKAIREQTISALVADAERCSVLGIGFLIVHAGRATRTKSDVGSQASAVSSRKTDSRSSDERMARGLELAAETVNEVIKLSADTVTLLVENTAGMGSEIGYTFEQLAAIISQVKKADRVGVVLDTAHAFAAGYEFRTRKGLDETLRRFDRTVGLSRLYLLHLNDAKAGLGSRLDRHWHIGKGAIGLEGFREIVNHPLLAHMPAIMETPRKSPDDDRDNMATARKLAQAGRHEV